MAERALIGALLAALITALARRLGMLDESGQWGAFACGVAAAAAGWPWAVLLVVYFVAASAVTALGGPRKAALTQRAVPQIRARDAAQVLANGALFSVMVLQAGGNSSSPYALAAIGALAAASADTWATEIGTLWGGTPRSIITAKPLAIGMSGGITLLGSAAAIFGALLIGATAVGVHDASDARALFVAAAGGGVLGAMADSALGATVQARRWCEHCKAWTERRVHPCSYRTVHAAGTRWITNDVVNAAATFVGAAGAVAIARALQ